MPLLTSGVDGQLVGFMGMNGHEIECLFLDPTCRGLGPGRAFIGEASAQSPHLEVDVSTQDSEAVAFYETAGFTAFASSPTDEDGRPYPILQMRR